MRGSISSSTSLTWISEVVEPAAAAMEAISSAMIELT